jgi:hypothetical protein
MEGVEEILIIPPNFPLRKGEVKPLFSKEGMGEITDKKSQSIYAG